MKKAFFALKNDNLSLLKECIESIFDASFENNWAIRYVSEKGHLGVVKFLATLPNVDASDLGNYAIQMASQYGHLGIVKFLASLHNVDASTDENWAIQMASENGHLEVVKFLLTLDSVRNSLSEEDLMAYMNQTKQFNL